MRMETKTCLNVRRLVIVIIKIGYSYCLFEILNHSYWILTGFVNF